MLTFLMMIEPQPLIEKKIYRLKPMVMLRLFAEASVLVILTLLPIVLFFAGAFASLPFHVRMVVCLLAVLAFGLSIGFCYLPFQVVVSVSGLQTVAALKRQDSAWKEMRTLKLKNSWGWRRYVLGLEEGELSFPFWLKNVHELVEIIRSRLPARGRTNFAAKQVYKLDPAAIFLQTGKALAQLVFVVVFWFFFCSLHASSATSREDITIILVSGLIFTSMMLWRFFTILDLPNLVEISDEGILLKSWFKSRKVPWTAITGIAAPYFILPDGIMLVTAKKRLLIGSSLDSFDELEEELRSRTRA
ncbi:MAG: PH domain-containing protein [Candidatus Obscuribacterales bacterium]|nr:PH domain-containing protein [Candidatus Obscuribacterales bacterium]